MANFQQSLSGTSFFEALALHLPSRIFQFGAQARQGWRVGTPIEAWPSVSQRQEISNTVWAFATLVLSAEPMLAVVAEVGMDKGW